MLARKVSVLVSGPYGALNLGDDAIALALVDQFRKGGLEVYLAANNPLKIKQELCKIIAVDRLNLRSFKFSSLKYILSCDVVVVGGGEQLSEPRVPNPVWGHLATNFQMLVISKLFRKKAIMFAVGVDENISWLGTKMLKGMLKIATFVSVRDPYSKERLHKLLPKKEIILGADPVFLLKKLDVITAKSITLKRLHLAKTEKSIAVIVSNDKFNSLDYIEAINSLVCLLTASGVNVVYALSDLQPGYDRDLYDNNLLCSNKRTYWLPPGEGGVWGLRNLIASVDCVVSSRMHPIIFSTVQGVPFVCLVRSVKMLSLMRMFEVSDYMNLNDLDADQLFRMVERLINVHSENSKQVSLGKLEEIKELAEIQFSKLFTSLDV